MEAQIYSAFILCHGSLQETIFYLNIECLQRSCCSLETADYEIIFCKNPIQKNLTATFINSSLFQCSQGSYGQLNIAIPLSGFVVYYHYLLLQKKKREKGKEKSPSSACSCSACYYSALSKQGMAAETEMRTGTRVWSRPTCALKPAIALQVLIAWFRRYTWGSVLLRNSQEIICDESICTM